MTHPTVQYTPLGSSKTLDIVSKQTIALSQKESSVFFFNKSRILNSSKIDQGSPSNYSAAYLASKFRISFRVTQRNNGI